MNEPIKIIFKAKNTNGKYQYHTYIFLGEIKKNIKDVLDRIKNMSLYNALLNMTKNDIAELNNFYGNLWYKYFFNKHHIAVFKNTLTTNVQMFDDLARKVGKEWLDEHITDAAPIQNFTYGMMVSRGLIHHKLRIKKKYEYDMPHVKKYFSGEALGNVSFDPIYGGAHDEVDEASEDVDTDGVDTDGVDNDNGDEVASDADSVEDGDNDEIRLDEEYQKLENLDMSDNAIDKKTYTMVNNVTGNTDYLVKKQSKMIKFDTSKDANIYNENISEVVEKKYITDQYIFRDDTIQTIKNKICLSIKNHPKFGHTRYIVPTRQYLWCEYLWDNRYNKVMMGIKWTQKNNLLMVNVEPNDNIRVYDELRGNIKNLKADMSRFNSKIRKADEDNNILRDYENYCDNHEIYMIDVYNELGLGYSPDSESLSNLTDTYIKIYFPKIYTLDMKNIIDYLGDNKANENEKISGIYNSIAINSNMEYEVMKIVEDVKAGESDYKYIMKDNYVTLFMIHLMLKSGDTTNFRRINLFKIFNDITLDDTYPFVQYINQDNKMLHKFNEEVLREYAKDNDSYKIISAWFKGSPATMSFKVRMKDIIGDDFRFITINLNILGRIDYKVQWKEDYKATVNDIPRTYEIINKLIDKLNQTSIKNKFEMPAPEDFKTAFITTNQRFQLGDEAANYNINHNDLSYFARLFFPYFALVIEPRKRESKVRQRDDKSKFGTYLRYKRISKYENAAKIEQRIYYLVRHYEFTNKTIIDEIGKQFNLTLEKAKEYYDKTMIKFSRLKKNGKKMKKMDELPKYKSPGIDVEIQGKTNDKYKIRISGARDVTQLSNIITALNVLLYLYTRVYLEKDKKWIHLLNKLKALTDIAERRKMVSDYAVYTGEKKNIKAMKNADKRRIGYTPEKGQSHWTRACQNSGKTQRRRPQHYFPHNIDKLIKSGYKYSNTTGMYEKQLDTIKNGKKYTRTLRVVKVNELNEAGEPVGNEIYYTCTPEKNGQHTYIGFLTKSRNPHDECMPCCFKKDQFASRNKGKKKFFSQCMNNEAAKISNMSFADKLYILQDTNKIQPERFGFLPRILDFYLNDMTKLTRLIAQHYLVSTPNGYFFKYGIHPHKNSCIASIASIIDMSIDDIMQLAISALNTDDGTLFTALDNGDIRNMFGSKKTYMDYLKNFDNIDDKYAIHLLSIPGVISKYGYNIIIFKKIKESITLDYMGKLRENCIMMCHNSEEAFLIDDDSRETILLYLDTQYNPICNVTKLSNQSKNVIVQKKFTKRDKFGIVQHIQNLQMLNCTNTLISDVYTGNIEEKLPSAKLLNNILMKNDNDEFKPVYQCIDAYNKCRRIITKNKTIIPVAPSGSIYNIPIISDIDDYLDKYNGMIVKYDALNRVFSNDFNIKIIGIVGTQSGDNVSIKYIVVNNGEKIRVIPETISISEVKKNNHSINTTVFDDNDIVMSKNVDVIDDRILMVNYENYVNEGYELFRYTMSDYLKKHESIRNEIINCIDANISSGEKNYTLKLLMYGLIDDELLGKYISINGAQNEDKMNGAKDKIAMIIEDVPDIAKYKISNVRMLCDSKSGSCEKNIHCSTSNKTCKFALTKRIAIMYVNKIVAEFIMKGMGANEILQQNSYSVSDIVNSNYFEEYPKHRIIRNAGEITKGILELLFGLTNSENDNEIPNEMSGKVIQDHGKFYVQDVKIGDNDILRAFTNCLYWHNNAYRRVNIRNLGYYGKLQTDIMVFIKSQIIDWARDKNNETKMIELLEKHSTDSSINAYISKLAIDSRTSKNGMAELNILYNIFRIPIVLYANGTIWRTIKKDEKIGADTLENYINISYTFNSNNPDVGVLSYVSAIYYKT